MSIIAPSILSADFAHLQRDADMVVAAGNPCRIIREITDEDRRYYYKREEIDGEAWKNISLSLRPCSKAVFDVHLMIIEPERYIHEFIKAGADIITIQVESTRDVDGCIDMIREAGVKPCVTLRPGTPVEELEPYLERVDMALVMTVEPGFGGQSFMPEMLRKVEWLDRYRKERGLPFLIEVDGGVGLKNAAQIVKAGADVLVAGSAVFGADDPAEGIRLLKNS